MGSLSKCLTVNDCPPSIAKQIRKLQKEYLADGYTGAEATAKAVQDVKNQTASHRDNIVKQINEQLKTEHPDLIPKTEHPAIEGVRKETGEENIRQVDPTSEEAQTVVKLAKKFGKKVVFFSGSNKANGFFKEKYSDTLFINIDSPHMLLFTFGHELTHSLKKDSHGLYLRLFQSLSGHVNDFDNFMKDLNENRVKQGLPELDALGAAEEFFADFSGEQFVDPKFWKKLLNEDQPLFAKVVELFHKLVGDITGKHFRAINKAQDVLNDVLKEYLITPKEIPEDFVDFEETKFSNKPVPKNFTMKQTLDGSYDAFAGKRRIANVTLMRPDKTKPNERASFMSSVRESYQRRGIATALYDYIEADLLKKNQKLVPSTTLTEEGFAFWKERNPSALGESMRLNREELLGETIRIKNNVGKIKSVADTLVIVEKPNGRTFVARFDTVDAQTDVEWDWLKKRDKSPDTAVERIQETIDAEHVPETDIFPEVKKDVVHFSLKTFGDEQEGYYKDLAENMIKDGYPKKKVLKFIDDITSVSALIHENRGVLDYESLGDGLYHAIKDNSDAQYLKSEDYTTICRKTLKIVATISDIMKKNKMALTAQQMSDVRDDLMKDNNIVNCGICYVFSRWINIGNALNQMAHKDVFIEAEMKRNAATVKGKKAQLAKQKGKIEKAKEDLRKAKETGKDVIEKKEKLAKVSEPIEVPKLINKKQAGEKWESIFGGIETELIYDMTRKHELGNKHPEAAKWLRQRGAGLGKAIETRTAYVPGLLSDLFNKATVKTQNLFSGMRMQSWSDFDALHLIDMMQVAMERAALGLAAHGYTKVPDFVRLMAPTGVFINMSLIPKGNGFNKDGSLRFDSVEGIDWETARELRKKYKTAGTIAIGISDEHIRALLAHPEIDFVIPYHASGLPDSLQKKLGEGWVSYEKQHGVSANDTQNDIIIDKKKAAARLKRLSSIINQKSRAEHIMSHEWWDIKATPKQNTKNFFEYARNNGVEPRFSQFENEPNAWKLMTDRKMVDDSGKYLEQKPTTLDFDMEMVNKILKDYIETPFDETTEGLSTPNPRVVDKWTNKHKPIGKPRVKQKSDIPMFGKSSFSVKNILKEKGHETISDSRRDAVTREVRAGRVSTQSMAYRITPQQAEKIRDLGAPEALRWLGGDNTGETGHYFVDIDFDRQVKEYSTGNMIPLYSKELKSYVDKIKMSQVHTTLGVVTVGDYPVYLDINDHENTAKFSVKKNYPVSKTSVQLFKNYPAYDPASTITTQISTTKSTYLRVPHIKDIKLDNLTGVILDASGGLGVGTKALRDKGFNVELFEPFFQTGKDKTGVESPDYSDINWDDVPENHFNLIINNAVLNVVPQDWRDIIVENIGKALKPGGQAFIAARSPGFIKTLSPGNFDLVGVNEVVLSNGAYQKGFTKDEMVNYTQSILGDQFTVTASPRDVRGKVGDVSVLIEKKPEVAKYSVVRKKLSDIKPPETKAFKRWFGNSKVVDKNGEPLIVHHGSIKKGLEEFDINAPPNARPEHETKGIYFTSDREVASSFTRKKGANFREPRGSVTAAYLSMQNPLDTTDMIKKRKRGVSFSDAKKEALKSLTPEHDGIIFRGDNYNNDEYVVFDSSQVKSALNNNGDYSKNNQNINYSVRRVTNQTELGFFSALAEGARNTKQDAMKAEGWINALRRQPNVKEEEIEWTGLRDWLSLMNGQKVTKDQVVTFLENDGVQIKEVLKGGQNKYEFSVRKNKHGFFDVIQTEVETGKEKRPEPPYHTEVAAQQAADSYNDSPNSTVVATKYHNYVLPGGMNYREVLLTLPTESTTVPEIGFNEAEAVLRKGGAVGVYYKNGFVKNVLSLDDLSDFGSNAYTFKDFDSFSEAEKAQNQNTFKSGHWDESNILAHIRLTDRMIKGDKVLFIEEIQSDWSLEGRKKGFIEKKKSRPTYKDAQDYFGIDDSAWNKIDEKDKRAYVDELIENREKVNNKVPKAPFVQNSGWQDLALKRIMRMAVEGGYVRVAWVTGKQTADRYSLDQQVKSIDVDTVGKEKLIYIMFSNNSDHTLFANSDGVITNSTTNQFKGKNIEEILGKEIADKIMSAKGEKTFSGNDLKIEAKWARELYDKAVPNWMKKFGKKHKVKVDSIPLEDGYQKEFDRYEITETNDGDIAVTKEHLPVTNSRDEVITFDTEEDAIALITELVEDELGMTRDEVEEGETQQQSMVIPGEMKEAVLQGQSLFSVKNLNKWRGDATFIEEPENHTFKDGEPVSFKAHHGTTHEFEEFNAEGTNPQNNVGPGNYLSTSEFDATDNYHEDGADLKARIDNRAEELADGLYDYPEEFDLTEKQQKQLENEDIPLIELATELAKAELVGGESRTLNLHVRFDNPLIIGSDWSQADQSHFDYEETYDEELDEYEVDEDSNGYRAAEILQEMVYDYPDLKVDNSIMNMQEDSASAYSILEDFNGQDVYDDRTGEAVYGGQLFGDFVQRMGYDGIIYQDASKNFPGMNMEPGAVHAVNWKSSNIKSQDQNNGQYDRSNPNIKYSSKRKTKADEVRDEIFENEQRPGVTGRISGIMKSIHESDIKNDFRQWLDKGRTLLIDKYNPIDKALGRQIYRLHRMLDNSGVITGTWLEHGNMSIKDGALFIKKGGTGFAKWLNKEVGGETKQFLSWVAAKRAEALDEEGREKWFLKEKREVIFDEAEKRGMTKKYEKWNKTLQGYNKNIIDTAVASGLISKEAQEQWMSDFYLPFYRLLEDPETAEEFLHAPASSKAFISSGIKKLEGGEAKIGDPLENLLQNWTHLIKETQRQIARQGAAEMMIDLGMAEEMSAGQLISVLGTSSIYGVRGLSDDNRIEYQIYEGMSKEEILEDIKGKKGLQLIEKQVLRTVNKNENNVMSFMREGKTVYVKVTDPELFEALTQVNTKKIDNGIITGASWFKRLLTYGATFGVSFRIANLIRDTLHTAVVSNSFLPVIDTFKGAVQVMRKSEDYVAVMSSGGGFGQGYLDSGDPKALTRVMEKATRKIEKGNRPMTILDTAAKALHLWEQIGHVSEMAARVQLYSNNKAKGKSHLDSAFEAKDILDFTSSGKSEAVRILIRVTPFTNARLQGLDRLARGAISDPRGFLIKGGLVTTASLALWAMYKDDDRYKELEDWQKWQYHNFWIGDQHFAIPKAFEVGAIFSTTFEAAADVAVNNEEMDYFADMMKHTAMQTFSLSPMPTIISPIAEIVYNKSAFTGRQLESDYMEKLDQGLRAKPWDSEVLKALGKKYDISPIKMKTLIRGYSATIGTGLLTVADAMYEFRDDVVSPQKTFAEFSGLDRFMKTRVSHTKYATRYHDFATEVNTLVNSINATKKVGDIDYVMKKINETPDYKSRKSLVKKVDKSLASLRKREKYIYSTTSLSREQKRVQLDSIMHKKNKIYKAAYEGIKKYKD